MSKRHYRRRTEQRFEYRIQKKLSGEGWLVINCTESRPFDLVALKDGHSILLELKSRLTNYPDEQRNYQHELCIKTGNGYILVQQLFERNKHGFRVGLEPFQIPAIALQVLQSSLSNFLD